MSIGLIYGICVVKNEDDIIADSLTFATRHCDRIFIVDNGSTDDTWKIVQDLAKQSDKIIPFEQTGEPFDNALRSRVYNALHRDLTDADWWFILDADEFLDGDPRLVLEEAMNSDADTINAWIIQFYFTERDAKGYENGSSNDHQPLFERRRHYLINWQEARIFRNDPRRRWSTNSYKPEWLRRVFRRRILIRHYQYRHPEQISKRLRLRHGHPQFSHVQSEDWQCVIRDSRRLNLHEDGVPWRFSPSGVLYFYRRNLYDRLWSACRGGAMRRIKRLVALK